MAHHPLTSSSQATPPSQSSSGCNKPCTAREQPPPLGPKDNKSAGLKDGASLQTRSTRPSSPAKKKSLTRGLASRANPGETIQQTGADRQLATSDPVPDGHHEHLKKQNENEETSKVNEIELISNGVSGDKSTYVILMDPMVSPRI